MQSRGQTPPAGPAGPTRPSLLHQWVISVPLSACRRNSVYNMTFSVQTLVAAASHQPRIPTRHRRSDSQEPRPSPIHDQPVPKLTVRNWIRRDTRLVETKALLDNWNECAGSVCSGARRVWRRGGARLGVVGLQQLPVAANASKKGKEGYATARDLAGGQPSRRLTGGGYKARESRGGTRRAAQASAGERETSSWRDSRGANGTF
jgi:hypothetical protein